jgi:uncharacterized protein involved in exopolysaccharide biosynthesis
MSSKVQSAHIGLTPPHLSSGPALQAAFSSLWRRKLLVLAIAAAALALGMFAVKTMPPRYTAEAYIRGDFAASDTTNKEEESMNGGAGAMSLDLVRVIETQSRLLQSHQVALRVVEELGLERLQPVINKRQWLPALFNDGGKTLANKNDIAATQLLYGLTVMSDPRAYLITVRYSAGDPELADLIANAFVAELLRSTKLQTLFQQRSAAQTTLSKQLAKFGDKHPAVAQARIRLAAFDELLKDQLSEMPDAILLSAGENVTKAISTPSSPKPLFVLGLLLFIGLLIGSGIALWLERHRGWGAFTRYRARPYA